MKVSELEGTLLDYWVAQAEEKDVYVYGECCFLRGAQREWYANPMGNYSPSTNWSQGGPIMDQERINTDWLDDGSEQWMASMPPYYGPTRLVAAMRCFVAKKFGDEVPDESV